MVVDLTRAQRLGWVGHGEVAVVDANGTVRALGGRAQGCVAVAGIARLCGAIPVLASGAADAAGFTAEELLVATSAVAPEALRRAVASSMLGKVRARLEAACPEMVPAVEALVRNAEEFTPLEAAQVALCCQRGWDPTALRSPEHPAQREVRAVVAAALGVRTGGRAEMGAGPAWSLARVAAMFADPAALDSDNRPGWVAAIERLRAAMLAHPELASGAEAIDTAIICATDGALLARHDPAGVLLLASPGQRLGIAIVDVGAVPARLARTAVEALGSLALVDDFTLERVARWLQLPDAGASRWPESRQTIA